MDSDTYDLIAQLCTRAGMVMEDTQLIALTIGSLPSEEQVAAIDAIKQAGERIVALANAAMALQD
jgi:precorrin-6B methylase 1